jgi:hypothetical protein
MIASLSKEGRRAYLDFVEYDPASERVRLGRVNLSAWAISIGLSLAIVLRDCMELGHRSDDFSERNRRFYVEPDP